MIRKICLFLGLSLLYSGAFCQIPGFKVADLQDYQYKKVASGGLRIQTNGISLFAEYGWIKDIYKERLLQIEWTYYVNYSQKRQSPQVPGGRDFIFGLQNHLNMLRISYGIKRTIVDKASHSGVRLSFIGFGGLSLALLKPYYLDLIDSIGNAQVIVPERYSAANASKFLSLYSINDAAPFRYGLNEIQVVPGIQGKAGLDFDFGAKDAFLAAIEAGVMLDLYYKDLPVMINNSNHFYQAALFLSVQFGKRW